MFCQSSRGLVRYPLRAHAKPIVPSPFSQGRKALSVFRFLSPLASVPLSSAPTSATSRALVRSPPMSCRAAPWSRPSHIAGPRVPTPARPRFALGEVHELPLASRFRVVI